MSNLDPNNRLGYSGDLSTFINNLALYFGLGPVTETSYLAEGYEDCNVRIATQSGAYVCKIFANNQLGDYSKSRRGSDVADRLVEIILSAGANGASVPELVSTDESYLYRENGLVALGYRWIEGDSYFELDRAPNEQELSQIIKQATLINSTDLHPVIYHDIWAIPNIHELAAKLSTFLSTEDATLIDQVLAKFDTIKLNELPQCLVHGDFTKGNVIVNHGKVFIIDFSVTNWTIRVLELVIIISNLLYDKTSQQSLQQKINLVTTLYQQHSTLTTAELEALPSLCLAGSAMELLGSRWRQEFLHDNSEETAYWLRLGRQGLIQGLQL
jgi:hypothetical protein